MVIEHVAARFGLGQPLHTPLPISGGLSNRMWRLDTDHGAFAVKQMIVNADRPTFLENVETAFTIERRAWAAGVPMPEPVVDPTNGRAVARIADALVRVHRWVDGTTGAGSPIEAAELLANIHTAGQPRWTSTSGPRWTGQGWDADLAAMARRVAPGPEDLLIVDSHGDLDRKNALRRADGVLIALDWDAAGPVSAVHEAVGVALDWSDAQPNLFADALAAYTRRSNVVVPAQDWVFAGWVAAQGAWLDHNATYRADTALGDGQVQATLAALHRVASRLDELVTALHQLS
jgi:hypothetical protein